MARVTEEKIILNVLKHLNEKGIPWNNSRFVVNNDEVSVLGDGGFAQVVLMEDINNPEIEYAVKILGLKADKRIHQNDYENYKREAILQYKLASECDTIVNILDKAIVSVKLDEKGVVEDVIADGSGADKFGWLAFVFIKMEKLEKIIEDTVTGDRLFCLPEVQNLDDQTSLEFAIDIAEALYTSHKKNVMHRDVKLENVFFDAESGKFKLGDFGIARITDHGSASTKGAGTLGYEAPEVTEEHGASDKYTNKADIYSYGATLYVLLNNLRFPGSKTYTVERDIQYNPNRKIENPEKGLPELKALVCRCLQYFPENRPESMEKILYELYMIYDKYYGESKVQEMSIEKIDETPIIMGISEEIHDNTIQDVIDTNYKTEDNNSSEMERTVVSNQIQSTSTVVAKSEQDQEKWGNNIFIGDLPLENQNVHVKQEQAEIGSVVAEVQLPVENKKKETISNDEEVKEQKKVSLNKKKNYKLYAGFGLMLIGLLLLELITSKAELMSYGMFTWSLCGISVVFSCASFIRKQKANKKLPSFIYVLLMCFAVFVILKEGNLWPIVLLAISLLIGGASETFIVSIGVALYPVLVLVKSMGVVSWLCNEKYVFIWLFAVILGFFWLEQHDSQEEIISMLFSETAFMLIWSIIISVTGIVLGIMKLLSVIDASSLLVNLHLLYVGIALFIVSIAQMGKEGYGS
ncbi:MAG: protein kinase [Lachnospiraceae bacterium]|nr:protein kinase [Lachnospiraceae bacterium]